MKLSIPMLENDEGTENAAIEDLLRRLYTAKQPLIIVDGFAPRYGIREEADELARLIRFPTSTTPFGKGIVNETYPNFHGVYASAAGKQVYMPWVNSCDLIVRIAPLNADTNTYGYKTLTNRNVTIDIGQNPLEICGAYRDLNNKSVSPQVTVPSGYLQTTTPRLIAGSRKHAANSRQTARPRQMLPSIRIPPGCGSRTSSAPATPS